MGAEPRVNRSADTLESVTLSVSTQSRKTCTKQCPRPSGCVFVWKPTTGDGIEVVYSQVPCNHTGAIQVIYTDAGRGGYYASPAVFRSYEK